MYKEVIYDYTQGPNYLWHTDGYEKLNPYGFSIHGCIDGYIVYNEYMYMIVYIGYHTMLHVQIL